MRRRRDSLGRKGALAAVLPQAAGVGFELRAKKAERAHIAAILVLFQTRLQNEDQKCVDCVSLRWIVRLAQSSLVRV